MARFAVDPADRGEKLIVKGGVTGRTAGFAVFRDIAEGAPAAFAANGVGFFSDSRFREQTAPEIPQIQTKAVPHGVQALLGGASGTEMQLCGFSIHRFLHMGSRQILAAILTRHTQSHPFSITPLRPAFVSSLPPAVYPVVQPVYPGTLCPTGPPP